MEQLRTKVEWVEGSPSQSFCTHSTFVPRCSNRLGPPEPSDRHFGRFGLCLGTPGLKLGGFRSSKLVQKPWPGPPKVRSNFVPRCSSRLGPPEPSNRHFGQFGLVLGCFWALEVPNFKNIGSGKWNEARGTLRVEKNVPVDPNCKKPLDPPLPHCGNPLCPTRGA